MTNLRIYNAPWIHFIHRGVDQGAAMIWLEFSARAHASSGKPEVLGALIPRARQPMAMSARPGTPSGDGIGEDNRISLDQGRRFKHRDRLVLDPDTRLDESSEEGGNGVYVI